MITGPRIAFALVALHAGISPSWCQQYPAKPIRIISPFAPGGGTDFTARLIAPPLTQALGQQVIVENRPGAGGTLGIESGVRSAPDGYTVVLISGGYTVNPGFYALKFDPVADISPVIQIVRGPLLLAAHPTMPVKSVKELIALARAKPGEINFSTSGQGSISHMAGELFSHMARVQMTHIPYRGAAPALIDTIAGQTILNIGGISSSLPYVKSGRLRAIAVTTAERVAEAPDILTVAESGLKGYEVTQWQGLIAPKGVALAIVERINAEISRAIRGKDIEERLQANGVSPAGGTPEQFLNLIRKEIALWRKVIASAGIRAN